MPSLETRNLIQVGDSLMIALPRPWLRFYKLEKGDVVQIIANGKLEVRPLKDDKHE